MSRAAAVAARAINLELLTSTSTISWELFEWSAEHMLSKSRLRSSAVAMAVACVAALPARGQGLPEARGEQMHSPDRSRTATPSGMLSIADLTEELRTRYGVPDNLHGVVVVDVRAGSDPAAKGVRQGDVLILLNGKAIRGTSDVHAIVDEARSGQRRKVLAGIHRAQRTAFVPLHLADENGAPLVANAAVQRALDTTAASPSPVMTAVSSGMNDAASVARGEWWGMDVQAGGRGIRVASVVLGSPASRAGVRPGSLVTHLNGLPLVGLSTDAFAQRLAGATDVTLRLDGVGDVRVVRSGIPITVEISQFLRDKGAAGSYPEQNYFTELDGTPYLFWFGLSGSLYNFKFGNTRPSDPLIAERDKFGKLRIGGYQVRVDGDRIEYWSHKGGFSFEFLPSGNIVYRKLRVDRGVVKEGHAVAMVRVTEQQAQEFMRESVRANVAKFYDRQNTLSAFSSALSAASSVAAEQSALAQPRLSATMEEARHQTFVEREGAARAMPPQAPLDGFTTAEPRTKAERAQTQAPTLTVTSPGSSASQDLPLSGPEARARYPAPPAQTATPNIPAHRCSAPPSGPKSVCPQ